MKARDRLLAPERDEFGEEYAPEDPGIVLDGGLTGIESGAGDVHLDESDDDGPHAL